MTRFKTILFVALFALPLIVCGCDKSESRSATPQSGKPVAVQADTPLLMQTESTIVHITRSGKKYHATGCSSLSRSDIRIDLEKAWARGYTACSRCRP